jgi:hypothetical protein
VIFKTRANALLPVWFLIAGEQISQAKKSPQPVHDDEATARGRTTSRQVDQKD